MLRSYVGTPLEQLKISKEDAEEVKENIADLKMLGELVPSWIWKSPSTALIDLIMAANGRLSLETLKMVDPAELAALAGISAGRMRNLISEGRFNPRRGKLLNSQAWEWIKLRAKDDDTPDEGPEEPIFVPCTSDGVTFQADEARFEGGYIVGRDQDERVVVDYFEALAALQHMGIPAWTMPNDDGEPSNVVGVRWVRVARPEIAATANASVTPSSTDSAPTTQSPDSTSIA